MKVGRMNIESYKLHSGSSYGCYQRSGKEPGEPVEVRGTVMTLHGLVSAYSWEPAPDSAQRVRPHSSYTMTFKGRHYHAGEGRARSARGLVIMAGKFARAVVSGRR